MGGARSLASLPAWLPLLLLVAALLSVDGNGNGNGNRSGTVLLVEASAQHRSMANFQGSTRKRFGTVDGWLKRSKKTLGATLIGGPMARRSELTKAISRGGGGGGTAVNANGMVQDPGSKSIDEVLVEWLEMVQKSKGKGRENSDGETILANSSLVKAHGLTSEESSRLLEIYGKNEIEELPPPSWFELIREQFEDRLVRILVGVAVLSALLEYTSSGGSGAVAESLWHRFAEPIVISSLLVINASVGVWQSKSAGNSIEALKAMQPSVCTVLRRRETNDDDKTVATEEIADYPSASLVPGDLIILKTGDKIPADCRLVRYYQGRRSLTVDETCLTGESIAVEKLLGKEGLALPKAPVQLQTGMVFSGTTVVSGAAVALVVATGSSTEFGRIQSGVLEAKRDSQDQKTPLAQQLDDFGNQLTGLIGVICVGVWFASIPKMLAKDSTVFSSPFEGMVYYAKVAVALGVAAIPEGLPAVITLCLSLGTRRMAQRNVIVRNLPSVETLGCVSVICSDKTGTLTTNEMTVKSLVLMEKSKKSPIVEHHVEGVSYSPYGNIEGAVAGGSSLISDVIAVAALCNEARIMGNDHDGKDSSNLQDFERTGEPTEAALCVLAEKLGALQSKDLGKDDAQHQDKPNSEVASYHVDQWREKHPRTAMLEFHRDRKSMSVLANFNGSQNGNYKARNRLLVKGAANMVLDRCTHVKYQDGSVAKISGSLRRQLEKKITDMATRPLRCLALAVKDESNLQPSLRNFQPRSDNDVRKHPLLKDPSKYKDIESGLTLVGLVGIKDPARPEVADSIQKCTDAGIRVIMITGDARDTAVAIAKDVNIFDKDSPADGKSLKAFEGQEFFLKSREEQIEILSKDNIVFCRAQPSDKQALIKMLQNDLGEIAAMTGDGVNDAPALQQAAIGVAMGTGTAVSKEAADMVLADDDFSTIVSAVEEGRTIYANMQAFICFLISCNIGEICAIFFATLLGFPEPLTAMHLLWVNLVTDGPPATALGFNPPSPNSMKEKPRPSNEPIMTKWLLIRYMLTGLYVGVATIGVFAQHYLQQGISLKQLSNWSNCGTDWTPVGGTSWPTSTNACSDLFREAGRTLPQTLSLTTLVCMEMFKALSAVSMNDSLFKVAPWRNKWLLFGVAGPFLLHLSVLYSSKLGLPGFGEAFGMVSLTKEHWKTVLFWSTPILLVDEILKFIGRRIAVKEKSAANESEE
mmetsp:Transcript_9845/g.29264  ORF Transcript_9845/g.29264 Transcript_9845/m.29264 type:complete len:1209 (+) Transcript_9845:304-3930(+)